MKLHRGKFVWHKSLHTRMIYLGDVAYERNHPHVFCWFDVRGNSGIHFYSSGHVRKELTSLREPISVSMIFRALIVFMESEHIHNLGNWKE